MIRTAAVAAACLLMLQPRTADACAGGTVSTSGSLGADAQRIFLAVDGAKTEVVVQVTVPSTSEDYGILIPVPARPTLDVTPVSSAELDALDTATQPAIIDNSSAGGGVGCGSAANDKAGGFRNGAMVIETAKIGPLTAVVLTASDGAELTAWLDENNFNIPSDGQALLDRYTGAGLYFIAAKRNQSAADNAPSSLGLHFTLPGEELGIPLPIAQLGGRAQVAFTLFVAADEAIGATGSYARLTLDDLDRTTVRDLAYSEALDEAVQKKNGRAFIEEGVYEKSVVTGHLATFTTAGQKISRLSTFTRTDALTETLILARNAEAPPSALDVTAEEDGGCRAANGLVSPLVYLGLFFAMLRLSRRLPSRSPSASAGRAR